MQSTVQLSRESNEKYVVYGHTEKDVRQCGRTEEDVHTAGVTMYDNVEEQKKTYTRPG